jgi:hypothetical protein
MVDAMLDTQRLREAHRSRSHLHESQQRAEQAQVAYQHAIRRLHAAGGSMREIADALGLSYQRVHQIVDLSTGKGAVKRRVARPPGAGPPRPTAAMTCAFCGSDGTRVQRLIAGPGVFICDRCVELAREVDGDHHQRANDLTTFVPVELTAPLASCSFCGRLRDHTEAMVQALPRQGVGGSGGIARDTWVSICRDCLLLCEELGGEPGTPPSSREDLEAEHSPPVTTAASIPTAGGGCRRR